MRLELRPSTWTTPAVGRIKLAAIASRVVLPHPGAPKRIAISPGLSVKSTRWRTATAVVGRGPGKISPAARNRSFSAEEMPWDACGPATDFVTAVKESAALLMLFRKGCRRQAQREESAAKNCGADPTSDG